MTDIDFPSKNDTKKRTKTHPLDSKSAVVISFLSAAATVSFPKRIMIERKSKQQTPMTQIQINNFLLFLALLGKECDFCFVCLLFCLFSERINQLKWRWVSSLDSYILFSTCFFIFIYKYFFFIKVEK